MITKFEKFCMTLSDQELEGFLYGIGAGTWTIRRFRKYLAQGMLKRDPSKHTISATPQGREIIERVLSLRNL